MPFAHLCVERLVEALDDLLEGSLGLLADLALLLDGLLDLRVVALEVSKEVRLPLEDLGDGDVVEVTVDTSEDERDHVGNGHRGVLLLLEQLSETLTTVESLLGGGIKIGTELSEGSNLTVLSQEQLQGTSDLLHGLDLGSRADTRDGKTDVNGRTDTLVEKFGLQEDLAVGNGNDVGRNIGRHITTLGLNDGESSEGTTTVGVVHLGGTLKETGVQVENVTRVGLTTGGTTEQQRHLTVGDGLLGKVIVDDDGVAAVVTEPLTHGTTSEGSKVLQRSSLGSSSSNDNGVLHGIVLLKGLDELSNGGTLLTDSNVDTVELLALVGSVVPTLLVQHGIKGDSGLTSLTVTNDQLTLTTANRNHGVDTLQTSLDGLVDGTTGQDTRGLELSTALGLGVEGALAVDWVTQSVDDTAEKLRTDGDINLVSSVSIFSISHHLTSKTTHNLSGTLDGLTLLDETVGTEKHNTDLAGFQVHAHALDARGEPDHH